MKMLRVRRTQILGIVEKATVAKPLALASFLLVLSGMPPNARADDCATMLKPTFDFMKQPGQWDIPPAVYATVTKQYASGSTNATLDPVRYSNGRLQYGKVFWGGQIGYFADTFFGTIPTASNKNGFAPGGLSLNLQVNASGGVSVQELLKGVPIGGLPPQIFQGSCSSGLVTVIDNHKNKTAWVISFTTTPPGEVPK